ncbi:MAG TPA: beta-L-arabinofuranosidase domain-containing protein, partial [Candidatus Sulfotelmatobacter sp.]|nr:beta-L-arabinofuranosidase domain-containing protein [Candidatus Sulfotelmatobacter sp.]
MRTSTRRSFLQSASLSLACAAGSPLWRSALVPDVATGAVLDEFGYSNVSFSDGLHESQLQNTHTVLMNLSEDSMLKPLRQMSGLPSPGEELGGWYLYNPDFDHRKGDTGFAPGATFGQWVSALARYYAITRDPATRKKVLRLNRLYAKTISGDFYEKNRFPAYCYDKLVCGLIDSHLYVKDPEAFAILDRTTDVALPHLPKTAVEHGVSWRPGTDESYTWDESYTISENLFLAYQRGAGLRYKQLGLQYLDDTYYAPLAEGRDNLAGRHAYSHVNSLCSAMQAYLTAGSEKHLRAATHGLDMLLAQSYATGGWGPDETLRAPGSDDLAASLTNTHNSFETPCGSYAHFKLTRYLLRVTRESRYGDSMERVMYNTILGAKPLQSDGRTFYYSDYNFDGKKIYKPGRWPCCSGTMPQIAADYRISTYFRDPRGVFVNLYIPSSLQWVEDGVRCSLRQTTDYPLLSDILLEVQAAQPKEFALNLRIPAWAEGATLSVNGKPWNTFPSPGNFVSIPRTWKTGDRLELHLPLKTRLEPLDANHPQIVALLSGPLVLFGISAKEGTFTRAQLLA